MLPTKEILSSKQGGLQSPFAFDFKPQAPAVRGRFHKRREGARRDDRDRAIKQSRGPKGAGPPLRVPNQRLTRRQRGGKTGKGAIPQEGHTTGPGGGWKKLQRALGPHQLRLPPTDNWGATEQGPERDWEGPAKQGRQDSLSRARRSQHPARQCRLK